MIGQPYSHCALWDSRDHAARTKAFIGIGYSHVTVFVISCADNAAVVRDEGGKTRVIKRADMSYASWFIAQQNWGTVATLKIKRWT